MAKKIKSEDFEVGDIVIDNLEDAKSYREEYISWLILEKYSYNACTVVVYESILIEDIGRIYKNSCISNKYYKKIGKADTTAFRLLYA